MSISSKCYSVSNIQSLSDREKESIYRLDAYFDKRFFWAQETWEQRWKDFDHYTLILGMMKDRVVGYSFYQIQLPDREQLHLQKIVVDTEFRGKGVSKHLIAPQFEIFLEVESNNDRAIAFYKKMGFRELRHLKGYYSDGSDAIAMSR